MSAQPHAFLGARADDQDPQETQEWLDALRAVIGEEGDQRAHFILDALIEDARQSGIDVPFSATTAYLNTIPADQEGEVPGNIEIEKRLRAYMRWNAMAMVVKRQPPQPGRRRRPGRSHRLLRLAGLDARRRLQPLLARRGRQDHGGDLLYIQGHSAPGIYARAFLEGRLSEQQLLTASARRSAARACRAIRTPS
jgi:pyruvate dehydrogenase E1 component